MKLVTAIKTCHVGEHVDLLIALPRHRSTFFFWYNIVQLNTTSLNLAVWQKKCSLLHTDSIFEFKREEWEGVEFEFCTLWLEINHFD